MSLSVSLCVFKSPAPCLVHKLYGSSYSAEGRHALQSFYYPRREKKEVYPHGGFDEDEIQLLPDFAF